MPGDRGRLTMMHVVRRAALVAGIVLASALFFAAGVTLRLLVGPISLGPFAGALEDAVNDAASGLVIRFDQAVLEWSRDEGKVNLVILGTRVFDLQGRIIAQAPKADLDLAAAPLLTGRAELKRIALIGVQLTVVRSTEGALRLGFGESRSEDNLSGPIRAALQAKAVPGATRGIDSFAVLDARLAFHDEETGLFLVSPGADLMVQGGQDGLLSAALDANIEVSGAEAHLVGKATLGPDGIPRRGEIEIRGLSLPALAANSETFAFLAPFGLTADLTASFELDANGRLASADFGAGGKGLLGRQAQDALAVPVSALRLVGRYDGAARRLLVEDIGLQGEHASGRGRVQIDLVAASGEVPPHVAFQGEADDIALDLAGVFAGPVRFERASVRGTYDRAVRRLTVEHAGLEADPLSLDAAGAVVFAGEASPEIALTGRMAAIDVRALLDFWPLGLGGGAREWIETNVLAGRIGSSTLQANIPAGALDGEKLADDALTFTLPLENLTAVYIAGLTPLTGMQGRGVLSGDTFRADVSTAAIGPLAVSEGHVVIPDLHAAAPSGEIAAHIAGTVQDVLRLIDQPRLGYPTRFKIDIDKTAGNAALDLDFAVPMLKDISVDQVRIAISARLTDFALALDERIRLADGDMTFKIGNDSLEGEGDTVFSGDRLHVKWRELFAPEAGPTTFLHAAGTLREGARIALGLPAADFVEGPIDVAVDLEGRRARIERGTLSADLTRTIFKPAAVTLDKAEGVPAAGKANLVSDADGSLELTDIAIAGRDIDIRGRLTLDPGGKIVSLNMPVVRSGPRNDFSATVETGANGRRIARIEGRAYDASGLVRLGGKSGGANADRPQAEETSADPDAWRAEKPLEIDAKIGRLFLEEDVSFDGVTLDMELQGDRLNAFALSAGVTAGGRIDGALENQEDGRRKLTVTASDASALTRGLTGFTSMRGGTLSFTAMLPAAAPPNPDGVLRQRSTPGYLGELKIDDFRIVDQPFLTRLFSAGSLGGILQLLQGSGIAFDTLEAPFSARGPIIIVRDGRAAGPAVGVSFQGTVDRRRDRLDISGTMLPLYGINSILGVVPLLGDVLVSKPGEGIIGLTFAIRGDIDEPGLTVNPLSVLTPGIFRRIFEFGSLPPVAPELPAAQPADGSPALVEIAPLPIVPPSSLPGPKPKPARPQPAGPEQAPEPETEEKGEGDGSPL